MHDTITRDTSPRCLLDKFVAVTRKFLDVEDVTIVMNPNSAAQLTAEAMPTKLSQIDHHTNVLLAPLLVNGNCIGNASVKTATTHRPYFSEDDELLFQELVKNISIALEKYYLLRTSSLQCKTAETLLSIVQALAADLPLGVILTKTVNSFGNVVNAEVISMYICDHSRKELNRVASNTSTEFLTIPNGTSIAGTVAERGKIVRIENAQHGTDSLPGSNSFYDEESSIKKTVFCVPISNLVDSSPPLGVVQFVYKTDRNLFRDDEEQAIIHICRQLSIVCRRRFLELLELTQVCRKKSLGLSLSAEYQSYLAVEAGILREYGARMTKTPIRRSNSTLILADLDFAEEDSFAQPHVGIATGLSIDARQRMIRDYSADPFVLSDVDLIETSVDMFVRYGLVEKFKLSQLTLRAFLQSVMQTYHRDNAFHNFHHAWGVLHMTKRILRSGVDVYLTPLEILTLLLCAICHDADHPGHNNAFEIATNSDRAQLYCDDAVLERHHSFLTLKLLTDPSVNLLSGLTVEQRQEMRKLILPLILCTDMSVHFKIVDEITSRTSLEAPYDRNDPASRRALMGHVLHCADIGAQTQERSVASKWTQRLVAEFQAQAQKEIDLHLPLTPFMHGLDDELKQMQLQSGFVGNIVIPLFSAFSVCFPALEHAVQQASSNKAFYDGEIDRITAERS